MVYNFRISFIVTYARKNQNIDKIGNLLSL